MLEKFDFYDLMSSLIPGVLLVSLIGILFPQILDQMIPDCNEAFAVIALTTLAVFVGQLLVAIGSIVEPILFWSWGGKPSELALTKGLGDRYMPYVKGQQIRVKLQSLNEQDVSTTSLFLKAMTLARCSGVGLSERFNALYAYQRTLVVLALVAFMLMVASCFWGALSGVSEYNCGTFFMVVISVFLICWQRAKQRAYYFVREVLLLAEREIENGK